MITQMVRAGMAVAIALAMLPACSSDAVAEPEPGLETPGAFVAADGYDGPGITVVRVLDRLHLETDVLLFVTVYDLHPADWDEAREASKRHDIRIRTELRIEPTNVFTDRPWRVVWFRSLTPEEEARVP